MENQNKDNPNGFALEQLEKVYHRQHYFIDRHDSMAEKFINVLLVEVTCFAVVFSFGKRDASNALISTIQIVLLSLFLLSFVIALCQLFFIIKPLSSKAKKKNDLSLIREEDKKWIEESSLYYQGIVAQITKAKEDQLVPAEQYLNRLTNGELCKDYTQQIFILARYSVYKKKKLETALKSIILTTILGILAVLSLLVL